ncbi:MAG TPA: hypothetical protein ENK75_01955 [Saprospiraceae bacterium]|nr:hypothetical protein [Saprospiraceae bacterium]
MKLFISLFSFLLCFQTFSQQTKYNLQQENLKGKLHYYIVKTFITKNPNEEPVQKYAAKKIFNTDGVLTEIDNYDADSKLLGKIIYEIKDGLLIRETFFNAIGNPDKITTYEYDEQGRVSTQKKINNAGKLQFQTTYLYNAKGQLSATHKLIPSINYTMKESYQYDAVGNLIEIAKKVRIGTTKELYAYNSQKQQIKKSEFNAIGELFSVITYEYNTKGDKTGLKKHDASGALTYFESYQYQYDEHDNWTERTSFEKGKKVSVEKRTITYYQ